jgi:hypothetical protein
MWFLCRTSEHLPAQCVVCTGGGARQKGKQPKGKGKAKAGNDGAGGGPSSKAAAAGSSSCEASTSRGECRRTSTLPAATTSLRSTVEDAAQAVVPSAEAASGTQQTNPQPKLTGGSKRDMQLQRKERQRQRRIEEARTAGAAGSIGGDGGGSEALVSHELP